MKDSNPLVSIVIPVHNRPAKIVTALESIRAQTYLDWEVIVVDDGSSDNTAKVIEQLASENARIRLIRHGHDRGAQAARNTGIRAAEGEWIAFLDSDDQWLPDSLELRLRVAERENVSVVHSGSYIIERNETVKLFRVEQPSGRVYNALLAGEGPMFQSLLVQKRALESIGLLDESIRSYQEWDTSIRLAKSYHFGFEPSATFIYDNRNPDSISRDALRNAIGYERVLKKHFLAILRYAGPEALSRHYWIAACLYASGGDESAAHRRALTSWLWKCLSPKRVFGRLRRLLY